ncbi:hypothetical protein DM826_02095 [Halonotius aquaticus]|uniref:Uncharacterized protein n=1 Tax=Halonotius aquaticus TaxID=2216978 RepID=A0A3A6PVC5_9EURY|nr:hypothetical protein [Halonotius aquaticus]RJX44431.1 hypothetical protein DM826_02095 [Halonotius aquaticus]
MAENDDTERYLYTVQYTEEAERKRVEYLFKNWNEGDIETPEGLARIAEGVDHEELYQELVAKVPSEQIGVYRLQPTTPEVESESITVTEEISASLDAVETFLEYILSKKKAVLQSGSRNEYEMYTKKGRAEVSYELDDTAGDIVVVRIRVDGIPPAPEFLGDFFETELGDYAASQSE